MDVIHIIFVTYLKSVRSNFLLLILTARAALGEKSSAAAADVSELTDAEVYWEFAHNVQ